MCGLGNSDWICYWGKHMKAECFKNVREYQKVGPTPTSNLLYYTCSNYDNTSRSIILADFLGFELVLSLFVSLMGFCLLGESFPGHLPNRAERQTISKLDSTAEQTRSETFQLLPQLVHPSSGLEAVEKMLGRRWL